NPILVTCPRVDRSADVQLEGFGHVVRPISVLSARNDSPRLVPVSGKTGHWEYPGRSPRRARRSETNHANRLECAAELAHISDSCFGLPGFRRPREARLFLEPSPGRAGRVPWPC